MISAKVKKAIGNSVVVSLLDKKDTLWKYLDPTLLSIALRDAKERKQQAETELLYLLSSSPAADEELTESVKIQIFLIQYQAAEIDTITQLLQETTNA
jgi:hypothetical protein